MKVVHTSAVPGGHRRRDRSAFSLVDLLVSIAVMSLLIALMLPSLARVQESSRRIVSSSNIRTQGMGLQFHAFDHDEKLPHSRFDQRGSNYGVYAPEQMVYLRAERTTFDLVTGRAMRLYATDEPRYVWDGHGVLYPMQYVSSPQVFYNPSHRDVHSFERYREFFYDEDGEIVSNYQYRWEHGMRSVSRINPMTTLLADAMRSQPEYSHIVGNNMLKADMSVSWYHDENGKLYDNLAETEPTVQASYALSSREGVIAGWDLLDSTSIRSGTAVRSTEVHSVVGAFFGDID